MVKDITILIEEDITDPLISGRTKHVSEFFFNAKNVLKNGGKVIVEGIDFNKKPSALSVFTTVEDLDKWKKMLNETQKFLERELIK